MAATNANWINHPGTYIIEELEERGWSQRDLAFILGCAEQAVNRILNGKGGISPEMAKALGDAFDVPAEFFANLQQAYDLARAKMPDPSVAARRDMQNTYPVREMIKRGWIELSDAALLETQLVRFFQVSDPSEIPYMQHAAKKSSYEEREIPPAQLAWLFRVRQIAMNTPAPKYSEKALLSALETLPDQLFEPEQTRNIPQILSECGVRYIIVEKLPNAKIDGVCFWLDQNSPVIGMSLQKDNIANFWFVLRHEIEHVLRKHGQDQEKIDADLEDASTENNDEERVANAAAADFCAPSDRLTNFMQRKHPFYYEKDVIAFSRIVKRHPGLVVGQMQRRLNDYRYLYRHLAKVRQFVTSAANVDGWGQAANVSLP